MKRSGVAPMGREDDVVLLLLEIRFLANSPPSPKFMLKSASAEAEALGLCS